MFITKIKSVAIALAIAAVSATVGADSHLSQVEFKAVPVVDGVTMLQGAGGNIGVLTGSDGLLVIDDDYRELGEKLKQTLNQMDGAEVKFLLNTHWHSDHSGNNQVLGNEGAIIIAHDNVRHKLQSGGEVKAFAMSIPPAGAAALPVITYADNMTLHWNGKRVEIEHVGPAHTDGDTVVYFYADDKLVAVQTGDIFFNGFYPFIDASSGGSSLGMIQAAADLLANIDDSVAIIPGHGPLASRVDLQQYHHFLQQVVGRIQAMKISGQSRQQVIEANPVAEYETQWGDGFLATDTWVGIVYDTL